MGDTGWLHKYAETILDMHPDFPDDVKWIWRDLRKACRVIDPYVPHCPICGWAVEGVHAEADPEGVASAWYRCAGCPKTWQHEAEIKRLFLTQPVPLTDLVLSLGELTADARARLGTLTGCASEADGGNVVDVDAA